MALCPSCKKENPPDAKFCLACGAALNGAPAPSNSSKWLKRLLNWRCCGAGCLVLLLVVLIGVPVFHVTVLRPFIQKQFFQNLENSAGKVSTAQRYQGGQTFMTLTEQELNDELKGVWNQLPGAKDGRVSLKQDLIVVNFTWYFGVKVETSFDVSVDERGDVVVKSLTMNWPLHLACTPDALQAELAKVINEKVLRPNAVAIQAFQVVRGKVFVAYGER